MLLKTAIILSVLLTPRLMLAGPTLSWQDTSEGARDDTQSHAFYQAPGTSNWIWLGTRSEQPGKGARIWDLAALFVALGITPAEGSCYTLISSNVQGVISIQAWTYDTATGYQTNRVCLTPAATTSWPAPHSALKVTNEKVQGTESDAEDHGKGLPRASGAAR